VHTAWKDTALVMSSSESNLAASWMGRALTLLGLGLGAWWGSGEEEGGEEVADGELAWSGLRCSLGEMSDSSLLGRLVLKLRECEMALSASCTVGARNAGTES
jgi:hypothetical protein